MGFEDNRYKLLLAALELLEDFIKQQPWENDNVAILGDKDKLLENLRDIASCEYPDLAERAEKAIKRLPDDW